MNAEHRPAAESPTHPTPADRTRALFFATLGFTLTFWAWSLVSPLGPQFVRNGLTTNPAVIVAIPVLVGSLGRIIVGAMTDRLGGRFMMPFIAAITVIPVLFVGLLGQFEYVSLIVGGFILGIAGTSFAVGVPYVNRWFPPEKRGGAIGIYGAGMGGTAISAFTTVPLYKVFPQLPFLIVAGVLIVYAVVAWFLMRNPPQWEPVKTSLLKTMGQTMRIKLTWQACYLYALTFGGYVAFSVYIPTMLNNAYGVSPEEASLRMAGFVIVAVAMRPLGGALSDRFGAVNVLIVNYVVIAVCALVLVFDPQNVVVYTTAFIVMAAGLGSGSGATFALIAEKSDPHRVGSITGFVGAAGGLGGFVPPLLLGAVWGASQTYTLGIILLVVFTVIALLVTLWVRSDHRKVPVN